METRVSDGGWVCGRRARGSVKRVRMNEGGSTWGLSLMMLDALTVQVSWWLGLAWISLSQLRGWVVLIK